MRYDDIIYCNYCDAHTYESHADQVSDPNWRVGIQGAVLDLTPVCKVVDSARLFNQAGKHACPDKLCQAKLFVWTRK